MNKDDIKQALREEVLEFLVKQDIDLTNEDEVNYILEKFYSESFVKYADNFNPDAIFDIEMVNGEIIVTVE